MWQSKKGINFLKWFTLESKKVILIWKRDYVLSCRLTFLVAFVEYLFTAQSISCVLSWHNLHNKLVSHESWYYYPHIVSELIGLPKDHLVNSRQWWDSNQGSLVWSSVSFVLEASAYCRFFFVARAKRRCDEAAKQQLHVTGESLWRSGWAGGGGETESFPHLCFSPKLVILNWFFDW